MKSSMGCQKKMAIFSRVSNINSFLVHIYDLKSGKHRVLENLESISIADSVPNQPGKVAVAISSGVYILDLATGDKKLLAHPETRSGYCYNDGKFDSHGRCARNRQKVIKFYRCFFFLSGLLPSSAGYGLDLSM